MLITHDVDVDIQCAENISATDAALGIQSNFFVQMSSPLYNTLSYESSRLLSLILSRNHSISLHLDPSASGSETILFYFKDIIDTIDLLSEVAKSECPWFNFHRIAGGAFKGIHFDEKEQGLQAQARQQVDAAVEEYQNQPPQAVTDMFDYLYENLPEPLQEQRAQLLEDQKHV